jgi:hypothetical protein
MHAQNPPDQLDAEIFVTSRAHGNQRRRTRRVKTKRHRHLEDQNLARLVVRQSEQTAIRFLSSVGGNLAFGETDLQKPLLRSLNALIFRVHLHEQQRREMNAQLLQLLLQAPV